MYKIKIITLTETIDFCKRKKRKEERKKVASCVGGALQHFYKLKAITKTKLENIARETLYAPNYRVIEYIYECIILYFIKYIPAIFLFLN